MHQSAALTGTPAQACRHFQLFNPNKVETISHHTCKCGSRFTYTELSSIKEQKWGRTQRALSNPCKITSNIHSWRWYKGFLKTQNPVHEPRLHLWENSAAEVATARFNVSIAAFTCFFSTYLTGHQQTPPPFESGPTQGFFLFKGKKNLNKIREIYVLRPKCPHCLTFHNLIKWAILLVGSKLQLLPPPPPFLAPHCVCDWLLVDTFLFMLVMTWSYPNDSGHNVENSLPQLCVYSHTATSAGSNWAHF